jgi:hypothetical protein
MTMQAADLDVLGDLAAALGLVDANGSFREDWLAKPGDYLSAVLAEPHQREALVTFVDTVLGGSTSSRAADGTVWLPIVERTAPDFHLFVVLDDRPATYVGIGLGVRLSAEAPTASVSAHVPLFRAAKSGSTIASPLLIGTAEAIVVLDAEITTDAAPPVPGRAHLGGISVRVAVPTAAGGAGPSVALTIRQLQMPGATGARDLTIDAASAGDLQGAVVDLILGLVRAQAAALPAGPLTALAGLLGLRDGIGVPPLPFHDLATRGIAALSAWLESVVRDAAARTAWIGQLANLLGGVAAVDRVELAIGPAQLTLGVTAVTASDGHTRLTPSLGIELAASSDAIVRADADLCTIDLGHGGAIALPRLALQLVLGRHAGGGTVLIDETAPTRLRVETLRAGLALDAARKPVFVLAADAVTIGTHVHDTLDLSTPDAIAEAAGVVLADVADAILAQLGPGGDAIRILLGLSSPAGHPEVPAIGVVAFLQDPLAAVAGHWQSMVRDHPAAVPSVIATFRDLVADAADAGGAVSGTGTPADPWRVGIAGPVDLLSWIDGNQLSIGPEITKTVDTLGQRCTLVESRLRVTAVTVDLAARQAAFLPGITAGFTLRARGRTDATFETALFTVTSDGIAFTLRWAPGSGFRGSFSAPNLTIDFGEGPLPVPLPVIDDSGQVTFGADQWDDVEPLIGALAAASGVQWLGDLAEMVGWQQPPRRTATGDVVQIRPSVHLRLADLVDDPAQALPAWLAALVIRDTELLRRGLSAISRLLSGKRGGISGVLTGTGRPADPWLVPLARVDAAPRLAVWLGPAGPVEKRGRSQPQALVWEPGDPGLGSPALAGALAYEAAFADDVAALIDGRANIVAGLDALVARWSGTDGRVVPPEIDPEGITLVRIVDATAAELIESINVDDIFETPPATIVRVAVATPTSLPWPGAPADRIVDLTTPGLAANALTLPAAATGEWFVALGGRAASRLPADDPDGIAGQTARLQRFLETLPGPAGGLLVIATAEAGHAARAACQAAAAVTDLFTLGTPLGPVSFAIIDTNPGADALRLLARLLPANPEISDDPDLAAGRGLVTALSSLWSSDDPARELQPPTPAFVPARAGLESRAVFGTMSDAAIRRAITAIVAAGLELRTGVRADRPVVEPSELHVGFRLPVPRGTPTVGDPVVDGYAQIELASLSIDDSGPHLSTARTAIVHCGLGRENGWLVGGPDPARAPGVVPDKALRRVSFDLTLPLTGDAAGRSAITLHEPSAYGIDRERWIVQPADASLPAGVDAATPALPEVRVLFSGMADALESATSGAAAALTAALRALKLLAPGGGSVPDAIDHFLHDPVAHVQTTIANAADHDALVAAIRDAFGAAPTAPGEVQVVVGPASLTMRLASRQLSIAAASSPADFGLVSWTLQCTIDAATGQVSGSATIGEAGATVAGGLQLRLSNGGLALHWHRPGVTSPDVLPVWPSPDAAAIARALARVLPAEVLRIGLESLRDLDETAAPVVSAALAAVGLLGPADADGVRRVLLPVALVTDPAAWFAHSTVLGGPGGFVPARFIALLDMLKPILGVDGDPGEWKFPPGFRVRADADSGGAARFALAIDSREFAPIPGATGRLALGGGFGLAFPPSGPPRVSFAFHAGTGDGSTDRPAVHVVFADDLRVFFRPSTGADLPLYPTSAGLGGLAQAAGQLITQALPFLLDKLAGLSGQAGIKGRVGDLVTAVGDTLALRSGGTFSGTALQAWAADPAAAFTARLPALSVTVLGELADVIRPLLPAGAVAAVDGADLRVQVGPIVVRLTPSPFAIAVSGDVAGVPAVDRVGFQIALAASGLRALDIEVGPATIDAGGVDLRPFFGVHAGAAPAGGRRAELALGLGGARRVGARWRLGDRLDLVVVDGAVEDADAGHVAIALLDAALGIVASFVMSTGALADLLAKPVGSVTVRDLLRGVLLNDADPTKLDANVFDPARLLVRVQRLGVNLATAAPSIDIDGLTVALAADDRGGGVSVAGVRIGLVRPVTVVDAGVTIRLETDARWIQPPAGPPIPAGIVIDAIRAGPAAGTFTFAPGVSVNGIGLRFSKPENPLLDVAGISLGSIALHLFGRIGDSEPAGGVQLQFSDLKVAVGGGSSGNPVAQGIVGDTGGGSQPLAAACSPALAVQKHGGGPVLVSLRAGDGSGPWWLSIQKGFGPLYVEQVGFAVTVRQDQLERISVLLDGRVSLIGLTASVDDLQLTYTVASNASVFDPSRWWVDLAGLAISSDIGGITIQGGLRKFGDGDTVQYVGMLMGRFGVYGLSVFGGYGHGLENGVRYASFFAFGAVNGPIGGPPAFFVTGIGGGLGINRRLVVPTDLSQFDQYPFIKALDPAAQPSPDPMAELTALSTYFPQARGSFWFAAGLSFTSFALVDGVVVVSVEAGDGLQIALLGLARMALPRPQFPLVSIELGLVARFSSKDGVLWVQAQLTDNSWLLFPEVRLTGGFAFVTWFTGPNRGQFVLTMGGFHPRFHRAGYPEVPRLGLQWRVSSAIAVKGEAYFALTSEAVMAGGRLEVSADFGPAWAHLVLGADGIIYFDPFHFEVEVYAKIKAGVTIDVWIGEITINVSITGRVLVEGPRFHARAKFGVGPVSLTVEFGDRHQPAHPFLPWSDFVRKYLEEAAPGVARILTAIPGKGSLPPGTGPGGATDTGTADGSSAKPFVVFAEFEITVTSTVPTARIDVGGALLQITPTRALGLAPMGIANAATTVRLNMLGAGGDHTAGLQRRLRRAPSFPIGVWGQPQHDDDRKIPNGDVIDAMDGVTLSAVAAIPPGLPPIDYRRRVETGKRHPLPFVSESAARPQLVDDAADVAALLPPSPTDAQVFAAGARWMARAGHGRTSLAALRNERAGPPRFGSLTDGLAAATVAAPAIAARVATDPPAVVTRVQMPVAIAAIRNPAPIVERPAPRTTAARGPAATMITRPPTLEGVTAVFDLAVPARLHRVAGAAGRVKGGTVVAADAVPATRAARGRVAAVSARGAAVDGRGYLKSLLAPASAGPQAAATAAPLLAGDVVVLAFPNASRDLDEGAARPRLRVTGGSVRVVALGCGGDVLADRDVATGAERDPDFTPPLGTERLAVAVAGDTFQDAPGLAGWHTGTALAYLGWSSALAAGSVVRAEGARVQSTRHRRTAGWIQGSELVDGTTIVTTRFVMPVATVVVVIDDPSGAEAGRNLSLGLEGANRPVAADGQPLPPRAVVRGNRTFLIYAVRQLDKSPVIVSVASEAGWHLAGVLAANVGAAEVADLLATRGLDTVVRPVLPGTTGSRTLSWIEPDDTPRPARARERAARASRANGERRERRTSERVGGAAGAKPPGSRKKKR